MDDSVESGQDITLKGKSGEQYRAKIYADKNGTSAITGKAIAVLSNSTETEQGWNHQVNSVYNTESVKDELEHFRNRNDISHLILLPYDQNQGSTVDKADDLVRSYIHR